MNNSIIKYLIGIASVGLFAFIISTYFFQVAIVHGSSMEPTYSDGNVIFVKKQYESIDRNDVIIGKQNGIFFIKRVVGIEGDRLVIIDGNLYVNDELIGMYTDIEDSGVLENTVELQKDEYFVLGDNVNNSIDSRSDKLGIIKEESIIGKVI